MATALELGPEGWKPYLEGLKARPEPTISPEQAAERDRLIEKAREAAAMLKEKYGATRVVLFGSLAHKIWFDDWSDVDLATDGVAGTDLYRAWADTVAIIREREVDLVDLTEARPSILQQIETHGIAL